MKPNKPKGKTTQQQVSPPKVKQADNAVADILKYAPLAFMGIVMLFVVYVRLRISGIPLERDEGEYAYVGQQLLDGIPPFVSIYHLKLPGIYAAYALMMIFTGQTHVGIHVGLLVVNLLTATTIYFIGKRIFDAKGGAVSAAVFMIYTLSASTGGFSANAEHFMMLPAMLGLLCMLRALEFGAEELTKKAMINFFVSGLLLGMAYLTKQHGVFFILFTGFFFLFKWFTGKTAAGERIFSGRWRDFFVFGFAFGTAVLIPLGVTSLIFLYLGLFSKFWWWTWYYPRQYATLISMSDAQVYFKATFSPDSPAGGIWGSFSYLLMLALVGAVGILFDRGWDRKVFTIPFFILSFMAVSIGFSYYPHYFLLAGPALAFLVAAAIHVLSLLLKRTGNSLLVGFAGFAIIAFVLGADIYHESAYMFDTDDDLQARNCYGGNPFPESLVIAKYIQENTQPTDRIAVMGSEPQIYFYSKRKSCSGFVYMYEMMRDIHDQPFCDSFQHQLAHEVEAAKPKYLVQVGITPSWIASGAQQRDTFILGWTARYITENYMQVAVIDIPWNGSPQSKDAIYCWDAPGQPPCTSKTNSRIGIYKRRAL